MSAEEYELLYFDGPGRAEATRILLHAAGIAFKDTRFDYGDWIETHQKTTPLGRVPVLKIGNIQYCQSVALTRFAAKLAGWYPEDSMEALKCDEIADSLNEFLDHAPWPYEGQEKSELKRLREDFQETIMTRYGTLIETRIQDNGGRYVVGKRPTFVDLILLKTVQGMETGIWEFLDPHFFDRYPGIMTTVTALQNNQTVVGYYESMTTKQTHEGKGNEP